MEIDNYTQEQIEYHAVLLGEAGLAVVVSATSFGSKSPGATITRLTWAGHEFLDAARDNTTWSKAKDVIGKIGGATLQVWLVVLTSYITKRLGLS